MQGDNIAKWLTVGLNPGSGQVAKLLILGVNGDDEFCPEGSCRNSRR